MAASKPIALYQLKESPFCQRVEMALYEAKAEFTLHDFDLGNKPKFYATKVNPLGEVPAIIYGGTPVPASQSPSPDSAVIPDSTVILEFLSEIYPEAQLLPKDPVERAQVRFFLEIVNKHFFKAASGVPAGTGSTFEDLFDKIELVQSLIQGTYAAGDQFTIADCALGPHLARLELQLSNDIGKYPVGEGKAAWKKFCTDPKYAKIRAYWANLKKRDSFVKSWDQEVNYKSWSTWVGRKAD